MITQTQVPQYPGCVFPNYLERIMPFPVLIAQFCAFRIEQCGFWLLLVNTADLCWASLCLLSRFVGFIQNSQKRPRAQLASEHSCGPCAAITESSAALCPPYQPQQWVIVFGPHLLLLPGQDRVWSVCYWGAWLPSSGWGCHLPAWVMSHPRNRSKIRKSCSLSQGFAQPLVSNLLWQSLRYLGVSRE